MRGDRARGNGRVGNYGVRVFQLDGIWEFENGVLEGGWLSGIFGVIRVERIWIDSRFTSGYSRHIGCLEHKLYECFFVHCE